MAGCSIVNLLELPDVVGERAPEMEGRFARSALETEHLGISHFRYGPGFRSPMAHRHREQEEVYVVVGGSGRLLADGAVHDLAAWDVVRVAPATVRAFEAGPDGLELLVAGSDRPEGGDGETFPAEWPA